MSSLMQNHSMLMLDLGVIRGLELGCLVAVIFSLTETETETENIDLQLTETETETEIIFKTETELKL